jgi:hypothetical protein
MPGGLVHRARVSPKLNNIEPFNPIAASFKLIISHVSIESILFKNDDWNAM